MKCRLIVHQNLNPIFNATCNPKVFHIRVNNKKNLAIKKTCLNGSRKLKWISKDKEGIYKITLTKKSISGWKELRIDRGGG